ncbi:hypothetical protein OIU77_028555 [Salix suchowensis]|uniref:Chaperonin 10 n=1 Tax=Salix suchowensis TaxID=1278906 RepID=A0ABQ9BHU6_9ROSI|nr:hypothetical protein OIU77_028555 [Salix suchowensis]
MLDYFNRNVKLLTRLYSELKPLLRPERPKDGLFPVLSKNSYRSWLKFISFILFKNFMLYIWIKKLFYSNVEKKTPKLNSGKVVVVGPGARDKDCKLIPVALKEGDTVLLPEYGGTEVKLGEKE